MPSSVLLTGSFLIEGRAGSEWKTRPQQQQRHQYAESQGEQPEAAPRPVEDVEPEPMYTRDGLKLALPRRPSKLPDPRAVPPLSTAAEGQPRDGDDNREDGDADDDVDDDDISAEIVPGGGYPKKLGAAMSYCRVSTKTTCEILIALGRVTVNGILAEDPNMRVDILKDMVVCDGETERGRRGKGEDVMIFTYVHVTVHVVFMRSRLFIHDSRVLSGTTISD